MKKIFKLCLLVTMLNNANAQVKPDLELAFAASYTNENTKDYAKAIGVLKNVYSEQSYELNLRLGWLSYINAQYNESIGFYEKAINLKPEAIEAKMGYVLPAAALGNWNNVLMQYKSILKLNPQNPVVNYRVGLIYYYRKDYKTAEPYFEKVIKAYPFDYDGVIMLAWTKLSLNKKDEASDLFYKALYYNPGDSSAKEGLALIK